MTQLDTIVKPMIPGDSPEIETAIIEMDALNAVLRVVENGTDPAPAIDLVKIALRHMPEPRTIGDRVVQAAMQKIVGGPINSCLMTPTTNEWESYVEQTLSLAWIDWARGIDSRERMDQLTEEDGHDSSAVHMIVLNFWREAITQLCKGDTTEARRMFKRALHLGSSYGTESHRVVSWSCAASLITSVDPPSGSGA